MASDRELDYALQYRRFQRAIAQGYLLPNPQETYSDSWQSNYEDFVRYDEINRKAATPVRVYTLSTYKPTHQPVVVKSRGEMQGRRRYAKDISNTDIFSEYILITPNFAPDSCEFFRMDATCIVENCHIIVN